MVKEKHDGRSKSGQKTSEKISSGEAHPGLFISGALLVVLAILLSHVVQPDLWQSDSSIGMQKPPRVVRVIRLNAEDPPHKLAEFPRRSAATGAPLLIKGSGLPVDALHCAFERNRVAELVPTSPVLESTAGGPPHFLVSYDARQPLQPDPSLDLASVGSDSLDSVSTSSLLERLKSPSETAPFLSSQHLSGDHLHSLALGCVPEQSGSGEDGPNNGTLLSNEAWALMSPWAYFDPDLPSTTVAHKFTLWLGSKGARSPVHFDWKHNFHVVLEGAKMFTIWPPSDFTNLHPFPFGHPLRRYSQIWKLSPGDRRPHAVNWTDYGLGLDAVDSTAVQEHWPLLSRAGAPYRVIVKENEALYIPPLWPHAVHTLEPTVSISVWSPSGAALDGDSLRLVPVRIPAEAPEASQRAGFALFVWTVLDESLKRDTDTQGIPGEPARFLRSVLASRFDGVALAEPSTEPRSVASLCPTTAEFLYILEGKSVEPYQQYVRGAILGLLQGSNRAAVELYLEQWLEVVAVEYTVGRLKLHPSAAKNWIICLFNLFNSNLKQQ